MMDHMMKVCMTGLTAAEKKVAKDHMKKMSKAEHEVMMKRCMMCMGDKHKGMMDKKVTDKMAMDHMMSGMSKKEQATMKAMMDKCTPEEAKVGKKMSMNCCMYGMKHGK